jgi:hypothetical protein
MKLVEKPGHHRRCSFSAMESITVSYFVILVPPPARMSVSVAKYLNKEVEYTAVLISQIASRLAPHSSD